MKAGSTLFHYFDESTGPFRNLSDLEPETAERVLDEIRDQRKGFASKRSADYLTVRRELETRAREMFIKKGGKPVRKSPHYMTVGSCPWLFEWFEEGRELQIPLAHFDPFVISFTYGDLFPTMRYQDGKPYRGQVYTLEEIERLVQEVGLPQAWNTTGSLGPERYIEVQVWDDKPLLEWILGTGQGESQHRAR